MFTKLDDTHFKLIGEKKENIFPTLDSRVYIMDVKKNFFGKDFIFSPMARYDDSKVAQVGIFKDVYEYTLGFFNESRIKLRKEMGFINKMNLILKGDPGTGKTHLACTVASELARTKNGIGIVVNSIEDIKFDELIDKIRINEPERLLIFVLDELEKNGRYELRNPDFLAFLDGAKSKENVIILSTVNSIEEFPNFLIKRPGRFEKIYDFVFNTEEVLGQLTTELLPERYKSNDELLEDLTLRALVGNIKTIDELRFLILDYLVAKENGKKIAPVEKQEPEVISKVEINSTGTDDELLEKIKQATWPGKLKEELEETINLN